MEEKKEMFGLLEHMLRPVFCVKENIIQFTNSAAQALLLLPGTDVRSLMLTGQAEYAAFTGGCLYLKLTLGCGASVTKLPEGDLFILDQESDDGQLQCLALAARELREPLTSVILSAQRLTISDTPEDREQAARLNRGIHQLLRIIGNMSDAGHSTHTSRQEIQNFSQLFAEIFEKAQALVEHTGISLSYQGLEEELLGLADREQLERAVLNILSNAIKFTPKGGRIEATLIRRDRTLRLSVADSGSGIAENILSSVFSRYLRQPGIEDGRWGLGLGMVLIRSAAVNHGGTVLIDQPNGQGTRITLTLTLRQDTSGLLRSPILRVDYTGERDHSLVELSDSLPLALYE